jgi:hypothetical protein
VIPKTIPKTRCEVAVELLEGGRLTGRLCSRSLHGNNHGRLVDQLENLSTPVLSHPHNKVARRYTQHLQGSATQRKPAYSRDHATPCECLPLPHSPTPRPPTRRIACPPTPQLSSRYDSRATHARTLLPAESASVPFGFVLVRVRVRVRSSIRHSLTFRNRVYVEPRPLRHDWLKRRREKKRTPKNCFKRGWRELTPRWRR